MKFNEKYECVCEECRVANEMEVSAWELQMFIDYNRMNYEGDLVSFEKNMQFASVVHWDVGGEGAEIYFVYRDVGGDMIAWYDWNDEVGFKEGF